MSTTPYADPTADKAIANVMRERSAIELDVVAGMAISSLLSRRATNEQCAEMMIGLARWWKPA